MAVQYVVEFRRDETGWWQARVPTVEGCHTQGRTINEARRRIREALSLFVDDAAKATLVDDIKLPAHYRRMLDTLAIDRDAERKYHGRVMLKLRRAATQLRKGRLGLSARDAAELLGVSHQRVDQLSHEKRRRRSG